MVRISRRVLLFGAAALSAATALAGCSASAAATGTGTQSGGGTVYFGVSAAVTGQYAQYGEQFKEAFDLAVEQVNADGGIDGHPVALKYEDSQSDPKQSVAVAQKFVGDDSVFRHVEAGPGRRVMAVGEACARERSYCQRVVDGRLPPLERNVPAREDFSRLPTFDFPIGSYLSVPLRLQGGRIYGVLCCFSFAPNEDLGQRDLRRLEMAAQLATRLIEELGT